MENKDDYLTDYRKFFEHFAETVNPKEQLPVKLGSYKFINLEVVGGIIDWTSQYLTEKKCPKSLLGPLIKIVIDEVRSACKKHPLVCGFNPSDDAYEPLKLMQSVITMTNEICLRYLDNSMLCSLPSPGPPYNLVTTHAVRNARRRMEDRHVIVHDLNTIFNDQEASPSSYYAVFDGHAGHDAAAYSAAHLHQFLAESKHFASNPEQALKDAFCKTDALFLEKCKVENFSSGTTAVCALHRPKEKSLYIAWVGDSQAVIANQGKYFQCVDPHRPSRKDERERIEKSGGMVMFWGSWRVSGQLAVSRAIGDGDYKPYVTAEPDIQEIVLNGTEDFLIIACDGLWDFVKDFDAVEMVYRMIYQNQEDIDSIPQRLVQFSKQEGSTDNISVIVVFLREPSKIAAEGHWVSRILQNMDAGLDNANAANNPFANSNGADILAAKDDFLLSFGGAFKTNGSSFMESMEHTPNGKRGFDDVDDLGPETDVDAMDDGMLSPVKEVSLENAYSMSDLEEKVAFEIDANYQKMDGDKTPREETPTPPVEEVHDGLVDNVAESGDDSEDEWNYIKGEEEAKISVPSEVPSQPDQEVADINSSAEADTMSQLNPHAAEFVPISPTRSIESPLGRVLKDEIIAQSPKKSTREIDINLPDLQDFEKEVKSRPSEVLGNEQDNSQKLSTQEIMENLLNGRNLDEIEFQPNGSPTKLVNLADEFHFGPNASPFSTPGKFLDQSEVLSSTKAVCGDDSMNAQELDTTSFVSFEKEQDPMSMSFYQDEDTNLFDLNKVQILPENVDEFIGEYKDKEIGNFNETISDLPEHNPAGEIITTDLDRQDDMEMLGIYELPKSPVLKIDTPEPTLDECLVPEAFARNTPDDGIAQNSEPLDDLSPEPIEQIVHSPESGYSPDLAAKSPTDFDNRVDSPVSTPSEHSVEYPKSPEPSAPQYEDLINTQDTTESNYLVNTSNVEGNLEFESHNLIHKAEVHEPYSPTMDNFRFEHIEPTLEMIPETQQQEQNLPEQNILESPLIECRLESPIDDATSSIKDDEPLIQVQPELHFAQEVSNAVQENLTTELSSPLSNEVLTSEIKPSKQIEEIQHVSEKIVECDKAEDEKDIEEIKIDTITSGSNIYEETKVIFDNDAAVDMLIPMEERLVSFRNENEEKVEETNNLLDKMTEAVALTGAAVTAMAAAATIGITSGAKKNENKAPSKSKPGAPTQAKKSTLKTATSPTKPAAKPLASKAAAPAKPATLTKPPAKTITKITSSKTPLSPKTTAAPKPKTATTNSDLKVSATKSSTLVKKAVPLATTKTASPTKPLAKVPATKTTVDSKTAAKPPPISKLSSARSTSTTTTNAAPKPRPTTLTTKTSTTTTKTTTTTTTKPSSASARTATLPKSTTLSQPKPKPASAPASTKPRVQLTKSAPKTADAEKQDKEAVNKMTASRTTSRTSSTAKSTNTKRIEPKVLSSRTTASKAPVAKKTSEPCKVPPIKRPAPKTAKPKENGVPNGLSHKGNESTTINENNINTDLVKDISPVENNLIMDNSQLPEATVIAD